MMNGSIIGLLGRVFDDGTASPQRMQQIADWGKSYEIQNHHQALYNAQLNGAVKPYGPRTCQWCKGPRVKAQCDGCGGVT